MALFLLDENLSPYLVELLTGRGHQASTAREHHLLAVDDVEILESAASLHLILITRNWLDFWNLHKQWRRLRPSERHAGILAVEQLPLARFGEMADAIDDLIRSGAPVENEYHRWRSRHGWQLYNI